MMCMEYFFKFLPTHVSLFMLNRSLVNVIHVESFVNVYWLIMVVKVLIASMMVMKLLMLVMVLIILIILLPMLFTWLSIATLALGS